MAAEMTERRQLLLKLVIQEYIENPMPVASELLVRKYGLNVSSATVRNELAVPGVGSGRAWAICPLVDAS